MKSFNLAVVLVYGTIVLVLTGVGIWDVTKIITDYISDNRITLVRLQKITDKYPFITEVQFCLRYGSELLENKDVEHAFAGGSIFEILLSLEKTEEYSYGRFVNETLSFAEQSNLDTVTNDTGQKSELISNLAVLFLAQTVHYFDDYPGPDFFEYLSRETSVPPSVIKKTMDSFITDPRNVELVKAAWNKVQPFFISWKYSWMTKPLVTYFDDVALPDTICFHISNWTIDSPYTSYYLDLIYPQLLKTNSNLISFSPFLTFLVSGQRVSFDEITAQPENGQTIDISIVNSGIFDSSEFPPCTLDFSNEDECLENLRAVTVSEICQCTRITDALSRASRPENVMGSITYDRFCTSQIYDQCWEKAINETTKKLEAAGKTKVCVPCKMFKNRFQVTTRPYESFEKFRLDLGRFLVNFMITDRTIMVFQEHPQFTVSQLISQVGGDLGLYIGFSMLGVLEVMLFLYSAWKRARPMMISGKNGRNGKNIGHRHYFGCFHGLATYIDKKFHHGAHVQTDNVQSIEPEKFGVPVAITPNTTVSQDWVLDLVSASHHELLKCIKEMEVKINQAVTGHHKEMMNEIKNELGQLSKRMDALEKLA